jgi:hypothetical protein
VFTKQSWLFETVWKATTALEASRTELEATERLLRNLLLMQLGYGFATADVIVDTTRITLATCAATVLLLSLHLCGCYGGAISYTKAR